MQNSNLKENSKQSDDRGYWFVRTNYGENYLDFTKNNFIAIGYNEIDINLLNSYLYLKASAPKQVMEFLKTKNYSNRKAFYAGHQLVRFAGEIKKGDIIISPSKDSKILAFGIISSNKPFEVDVKDNSSISSSYRKRWRVKWMNRESRQHLNPYLYQIFNTRHIITNIGKYSMYIDPYIHDAYFKNDQYYLSLRIKQSDAIPLSDLMVFDEVLSVVGDFVDEANLNFSVDDVKFRINVQSPGDLLLYGSKIVFALGFLIVAINGGGIEIPKLGFKLKTNGVLQSITHYLDHKVSRELKRSIKEKLDNMKIDNPKDIGQILNELNKDGDDFQE